jgi:hypothetical protein
MKKILSLALLFLSISAMSQNYKLEEKSILSGENKIGTFELVADTLKIVLFEKANVESMVPNMVIELGVDPKAVHYISESSFMGKGSIRELEVYIPSPKKTPPSKDRVQFAYNLGRHTDMVSLRLKYYRYYGIDATLGTSIHRIDNQKNFAYLGLSNEFNQFYRLGWRGHASIGPILMVTSNTNEMSVSGAACLSLQKSFGANAYFGPKWIIGGYNELSLGVVIGL